MRKNYSKDYLIELKEGLNRNTVTECSCLWIYKGPPQNERKKNFIVTYSLHSPWYHQTKKANVFVKFVKKPKEFKKTSLKLKFNVANSNKHWMCQNGPVTAEFMIFTMYIIDKIAHNYLRRQKTLAVPCCLKSCIYCSSRSPWKL